MRIRSLAQMAVISLAASINPTSAESLQRVQQGADLLNLDAQYKSFFRQIKADYPPSNRLTDSHGINVLDLDRHYRRFFNDLGIDGAANAQNGAPESLISPPGIESTNPEAELTQPLGVRLNHEKANATGLWSTLQNGFQLPEMDSPLVDSYENWFAQHPSYLNRVFTRGAIYLPYIIEQIQARSLPMEIALLPVIESAFNPFAESRAKAVGMWQFISGTAKRYGLRMDFWYDGRRDIIDSTRAALDYLQFLENDMQGNWFHAFASYNGGEHRLHKEIRKNAKKGKSTDFVHLRLYKETRHYVPRLVALRNVIRNPQRFGIELPDIKITARFQQLKIKYPIDLGIAAELAGLSVNQLRKLNPGYRRRSTGSEGESRLLLPEKNAATLQTALTSRSAKSLIAATGYRVRKGDTLSQIAKRNSLTIRSIKTANRLKGDFLRVGQELTLPIHSQRYSAIGSDGLRIFEDNNGKAEISKNNNAAITHRVKRGDTLSAIARRYRVYVKQIAKWNSMRSTDLIHSGQKLVIFQ